MTSNPLISVALHQRSGGGLAALALLMAAIAGSWLASSGAAAAVGSGGQLSGGPATRSVPVPPLPDAAIIESLSDTELTALSVHWSQLAPEQRRALLKTVKTRMLQQKWAARQPSPLQSQRRFGRVVRQRDGSVVTIETRVFQSADGTVGRISQRMTFGAGFEQRQRSAQLAAQSSAAEAQPPGDPLPGNAGLESIPAPVQAGRLDATRVSSKLTAPATGSVTGTATGPRQ